MGFLSLFGGAHYQHIDDHLRHSILWQQN